MYPVVATSKARSLVLSLPTRGPPRVRMHSHEKPLVVKPTFHFYRHLIELIRVTVYSPVED